MDEDNDAEEDDGKDMQDNAEEEEEQASDEDPEDAKEEEEKASEEDNEETSDNDDEETPDKDTEEDMQADAKEEEEPMSNGELEDDDSAYDGEGASNKASKHASKFRPFTNGLDLDIVTKDFRFIVEREKEKEFRDWTQSPAFLGIIY